MRKYILNTLYFLLLLALVNILINHFGNKIYLGTYKAVSLNYNTFLLADSHGLPLGNNTEKFGVYNFSAESESYFDMKRKLNFLIEKTTVDTIYITVDDQTLSPYRETSNNLDRSVYFSTIEDYSNIYTFLKDKLILNIAFFQPKKGLLLKRYISSSIKKDIFHITSEDDLNKTQWSTLDQYQRLSESKKRFEYQYPIKQKSKKLENTLTEIINICKENKIVLIGLRFPLTKDYIDVLDGFTYGASNIFKENSLNVLDYTEIFINNNEFFEDQDHMNVDGGNHFIERVFGTKKKY